MAFWFLFFGFLDIWKHMCVRIHVCIYIHIVLEHCAWDILLGISRNLIKLVLFNKFNYLSKYKLIYVVLYIYSRISTPMLILLWLVHNPNPKITFRWWWIKHLDLRRTHVDQNPRRKLSTSQQTCMLIAIYIPNIQKADCRENSHSAFMLNKQFCSISTSQFLNQRKQHTKSWMLASLHLNNQYPHKLHQHQKIIPKILQRQE